MENWSAIRRLVSGGGSLYAHTLLGLPIRDVTGGFKCFRREALEALDLTGMRSNGYGFQVEMNYLCHQGDLRISEVPIVFPDHVVGDSKMSCPIFLEAAVLVLKLRYRDVRETRGESRPESSLRDVKSGGIRGGEVTARGPFRVGEDMRSR